MFANERCGGVRLLVTDGGGLDAVQIGLTLGVLLRRLYPDDWKPEKLMTLLANQVIYDALAAGENYNHLFPLWLADRQNFFARRKPFLLYK